MVDFLPMDNTTSTKCGSLLIGALTKDLVTSPDVETSTTRPTKDGNDALLYIITVLLFYACSIVVLMVKYIRREKQEAEFRNYFHEYVIRDQFRQPQYQNLSYMCHLMKLPTKGSCKVSPQHAPTSAENHFSQNHVDVLEEEKQKFFVETSI